MIIPTFNGIFLQNLLGSSLTFFNYSIDNNSESGFIIYGGENNTGLANNIIYNLDVKSFPIIQVSIRNQSILQPQGRIAHQSIFYSNGSYAKIFMFGGYFLSSGLFTNDFWTFDLISNNWIQLNQRVPPSRGAFIWNQFRESSFILYGGIDLESTIIYKNDFWNFDASIEQWIPLTFSNNQYTLGCYYGLEGPFGGYSKINDSLFIYGGNNELITSMGEAQIPTNFIWSVNLTSFPNNNNNAILPTNIIYSVFVSQYVILSGSITIPAIGFPALNGESGQYALFSANVGSIFSTTFDFSLGFVEFDPNAYWNFDFVFQSSDEWLFYATLLNGTQIFIGSTNNSIPFINSIPFNNSTYNNRNNSFYQFNSLNNYLVSDFSNWTNSNLFLNQSTIPFIPITIKSNRLSNNTNDLPHVNVSTLVIKVCVRCSVAVTPPPIVPTPDVSSGWGLYTIIAVVIGCVGGFCIILAIVGILTMRFHKRKRKMELDQSLPNELLNHLIELHPVNDVIISRKISSGNYGNIYLGVAYNGSARVALKKLKIINVNSLLKELEILVSLRHPNIVQFYGTFFLENEEKKKEIYLVMEFIEKGSILDWIKSTTKIINKNIEISYDHKEFIPYGDKEFLRDKIKICIDICKGMIYLHSIDIIHGDLAARNILVTENNNAKICDFGFSLKKDHLRNSFHKDLKLPIRWCSPEVLSKGEYSKYSDIWSFGVLMYEIFTNGLVPYSELPLEVIYEKIIKESYIMEKPIEINDQLWSIMLKCWNKIPSERSSFIDLAKDLMYIKVDLELNLLDNSNKKIEISEEILEKSQNKIKLNENYYHSPIPNGIPIQYIIDLKTKPMNETYHLSPISKNQSKNESKNESNNNNYHTSPYIKNDYGINYINKFNKKQENENDYELTPTIIPYSDYKL
jgi:serine/threonine protein kinase